MLESPRQQLSRATSRLTQTAGLTSLELAADVVAFAYGTVAASVQVAIGEVVDDALTQLRVPAPSALTPVQFAVTAESTFAAFSDGERARGRFAMERGIELRRDFTNAVRGSVRPSATPSLLTMSGVPHPAHFRLFFQITTNGDDPRGPGAFPPLERLVGRVGQLRGPRNDFAHECADPTQHQSVVGRSQDLAGLSGKVSELQIVIADLAILMDVLELACSRLRYTLAGHPPATAPGRRHQWQNYARRIVGSRVGRPSNRQ